MPEETYVGPCKLTEALDAADAVTVNHTQIALATSCPEGAWVALRLRDVDGAQLTLLRRENDISGQSGSIAGTGRWVTPDSEEEKMARNLSWRPL